MKDTKRQCSHFKNNTCVVIKEEVPEKQILEYCKGLYMACRYYKKKI